MSSGRMAVLFGVMVGILVGFMLSQCGFFSSNLPAYDEQKEKIERRLARMVYPSRRFVEAARLVTPAVVHITSIGERVIRDPFADFFDDPFFRRFFGERMPKWRRIPITAFGSGVIVSNDGLVLTNNHVVRGGNRFVVKLGDGREFEAELLGADDRTDLAVLKIDGSNLPFASLGDSSKIEVGEWVLAIGNPFGLEQTVTAGIVSAKGRAGVGILDYEDFIQTDAAINPGNSGGPLVNMDGKVVGITTAIVSRTGGYQGIGFAVPSNIAKTVMESIKKFGRIRRGFLGLHMETMTPELARSLRIRYRQGVYIVEVVEGSPADRAGVRAGDIVVSVNGQPIRSAVELRNIIVTRELGTELTLGIMRGSEKINVKAKVSSKSDGF